MSDKKLDTAIFACGCFWCLEAQFQYLDGVEEIISGYSGGASPHPTYQTVLTGVTGHAETCKIHFDPSVISYKELVLAFFKTHDPTQLNRQGNDIGTQYRSAIFYLNNSQQREAEDCLDYLKREKVFEAPIVTEITEAGNFYPAEKEHKEFYNNHPNVPYCQIVVKPKINKFLKYLKERKNEGDWVA